MSNLSTEEKYNNKKINMNIEEEETPKSKCCNAEIEIIEDEDENCNYVYHDRCSKCGEYIS